MKKAFDTIYKFFIAWAEAWNEYKNARYRYY